MPQFLICPISGKTRILAPAVGFFRERSCHLQPPPGCRWLGAISRLNETIPLCIESTSGYQLCVSPNTWLMAGDLIAQLVADPCPHHIITTRQIMSPSDGFLIFETPDSRPMIPPNTVISPGTVVAVIELMKIRMDITYDGTENVRFLGYIGPSSRPVRRGDPIANLISIEP